MTVPSHALHRAHQLADSYDTWLLFVDVGTALWLVAYILAIVQGFKQKTYAIPLVAVSLNFSWEVLAAFAFKEPILLWRIGDILWMGIDGIIVYQVFRFGRDKQNVPEVRNWYYPFLIGLFALAFVGQYTLTAYIGDDLGFEDAYFISIVMGALFITMYFARREAGNLAYGIAWTKMLGTGLTSLALVFIFPRFYPGKPTYAFMYFVYALCLLLDGTYVVLLARARAASNAPAKVAPVASIATA